MQSEYAFILVFDWHLCGQDHALSAFLLILEGMVLLTVEDHWQVQPLFELCLGYLKSYDDL